MAKHKKNPGGRPPEGNTEATKRLTGPHALFAAMESRARELDIKGAEAWRRAAQMWLKAGGT
jgi:hypothetical protein